MLIKQFNLLNDLEKEKTVSAVGIFLGYYEEHGYMSDIYKLFNFYVEFTYDIHKNEGVLITTNLNPEKLPVMVKILDPVVNAEQKVKK